MKVGVKLLKKVGKNEWIPVCGNCRQEVDGDYCPKCGIKLFNTAEELMKWRKEQT